MCGVALGYVSMFIWLTEGHRGSRGDAIVEESEGEVYRVDDGKCRGGLYITIGRVWRV